MYSHLLRLRSRQIRRQLAHPGIVYGMLLAMAVTVMILFLWQQFRDPHRAWLTAGIIAFAIFSIHIARKDKPFVLNQLPAPGRQLFLEYAVLSLPATLPCLFTWQWYLFPLLLLSFRGIAHLRITLKQRTAFPHLSRIIPARNFELLSLLRKNYLLFIFLYLAAWATSGIIIVPVAILWLLTLSLLSAYQECESYDLLTVAPVTAAVFLKQKIIRHWRMLLAITLPVLLVNVALHPSYIWLHVFLLLVQPVLIMLGVSFKYSQYEPGQQLTAGNILLSVIAGSSLIPFLLPMPLLFAIRYYKQAIAHLNTYFHDPNP